jgi:hypothetical protein
MINWARYIIEVPFQHLDPALFIIKVYAFIMMAKSFVHLLGRYPKIEIADLVICHTYPLCPI